MDAVREKKYRIYFGGSYRECWSEDYTMSVIYSDRAYVEAELLNGKWTAVSGDTELCETLRSDNCPGLMRQYFEAAASAYDAAQECLHHGVGLECLPEYFHSSGNALVAPELMRLLMDDCGFSLNEAYGITIRCCADCRATGIDSSSVYALQPRTSHLVSILRKTASSILSVEHISTSPEYRAPLGAVCSGEGVKLSVKVLSGSVRRISVVILEDSVRTELPLDDRDGSLWSVTFETPERGVAMWYFFKIETADGSHWLCPDKTGFRGKLYGREEGSFRLTVYLREFDTPAWFRKATMYQIFPDRFGFSPEDDTAKKGVEYHRTLGQTAELHKSLDEPVRHMPRPFEKDYIPDDFYGGTFRGIEHKLPYLRDLGINCLYFNPIVEARSNHRYDASDFMKPDPILGSVEDFEHLCHAAKEMGIHIILDGAYSHTGADSVYFNRYGHYDSVGACQSKESPYYSWFDFQHYPDTYRSWWGFTELPEVEETNPEYDKYIISGENSVVKTWLRRGASGWRLDVADEIPDSVLSRIRDAVKNTNPDAPIIGEVWDDAVIKYSYGTMRNYALGYSLDSVMNYPLRNAVLDFLHQRSDAYALRDFLVSQQMNYPRPMYYALMNFLGTHDVDRLRTNLATDINIRALTREEQLKLRFSEKSLKKAEKLEKLGAAILYSLPGVPSLYYGDEQGMCGVCDPFNRAPFKETGSDLHGEYKTLINTRRKSDALTTGKALYFAASTEVLMILRYIDNGEDVFGNTAENGAYLTVINRSAEKRWFEADCTAAGKGFIPGAVEPFSYKMIKLD